MHYLIFHPTKQGTYFKKLEKLLESNLNLATSNEKDITDSNEKTQNGTPSAKSKLAVFAYRENNENGTNTAEKSPNKKKLKVDDKKPESNGHGIKKENEVEGNGIKKGQEEEEEEKMDTEDSVPSPPQKKQTKGESSQPLVQNTTHIDKLHLFHTLPKPLNCELVIV